MNQKFVKYYSAIAMCQRMGKTYKEYDNITDIKNDYISWQYFEKTKKGCKKKVRKIK